ncbi:hypothetical protein U9M48_038582 [Paspalum notatum var. saurae]|uniref:Integrase catalytic domain-containing protein n=1 Tax=Paspalum notatum var. saurae TaxID=547442 RepID=A0AAQ3ULM8_PASNO
MCTDRGCEFTSCTFIEHCMQEGVQRHYTVPYTPQQNGVVEQRNQVMMGMVRSMMKAMSMPGWFWGKAVTTVVLILDRSPTQSVNGKTPFEVWRGVKPSVHILRTFGCVAHVKAGGKHLTKLEDRSSNGVCRLRGGDQGMEVLQPCHATRSRVAQVQAMTASRSASIGGGRHEAGARAATGTPPATLVPETPISTPMSVAMPTCRSEPRTPVALSTPTAPSAVQFATLPSGELDLNEDHDDDVPLRFRTMDNVLGLGSPPCLANRELTQELLVVIGDEPASVEEAKVSKARRERVRVVRAVAAHRGWSMHHMDVKSVFLNGELAEEVYVAQPPGFTTARHKDKVLKLHKALYDLHQAPRAWNATLDASLHELGFTKSKCEYGLYMHGTEASRLVVGVYVNDLLITGERLMEIEAFKGEMKKLFRMSDLGPLFYYLGIKVKQGRCGIELHQSAYANDGAKLTLLGFSNSDMAGDADGRKSTTGEIFFFGGNPVMWLSQKQCVVALSSCEAEFIAGASVACQAVWLRRLLGTSLAQAFLHRC